MLPDYSPLESESPPGNPNMPFGYLAGLIGWIGKARDEWEIFTYKGLKIFHQRIWDRVFKQTGKIEVDESYKLDFGLLKEFSKEGGVVGYHCNVWERSLFNIDKAKVLFKHDIDSLRSKIEIN